MRQYADFLHQTYGAAHVQSLSVAEGRRLCDTDAYHGGFIDWNSAHLHPLKYVLGLANAAQHWVFKFLNNPWSRRSNTNHTKFK